jgi:hypothetical protein
MSNTDRQAEILAIEAASAEITTATVTIRTLRVNSRQLTMGTFRQFPKMDLIDEELVELKGSVWGWVNYDAGPYDKCFVIQVGDGLYRSPFSERDLVAWNGNNWPHPLRYFDEQYWLAAENYILVCAIQGCLKFHHKPDHLKPLEFKVKPRPFFGSGSVKVGAGQELDGSVRYLFSRRLLPEKEKFLQRQNPGGGWENYTVPIPPDAIEKNMQSCVDQLAALLEKRSPKHHGESLEYWDNELDHIASNAADYVSRWNALMAELRTAKQLFIAT